jgi:hypothetical protein
MAAVGGLDDRFARVGITVLRHTGLRIGELLDLELRDLLDYGTSGTWLRVPLGKLHNERSVPVDDVRSKPSTSGSDSASRNEPDPTHATDTPPTSSSSNEAAVSALPASSAACATP